MDVGARLEPMKNHKCYDTKVDTSAKQILTINIGSSGIKLVLFGSEPLVRLLEVSVSNIGQPHASLCIRRDGKIVHSAPAKATNHRQAINFIFHQSQHLMNLDDVTAISHRLVCVGPAFTGPVVITPAVINDLRSEAHHRPQPTAVAVELIEAFHKRQPNTPQVACFDDAFYSGLSATAKPSVLQPGSDAVNIPIMSFHGLSYASLIEQFRLRAGEAAASGRIILAHLGSTASLAAIKEGKMVDVVMPFPNIPKQYPDMKILISNSGKNKHAREAVELFGYQVRKAIGSLTAAAGGLDSLIFSGGIGEHSWVIRSSVCGGLGYLGIELDEKRNKSNDFLISSPGSRVGVHVIQGDEAKVLAQQALQILEK